MIFQILQSWYAYICSFFLHTLISVRLLLWTMGHWITVQSCMKPLIPVTDSTLLFMYHIFSISQLASGISYYNNVESHSRNTKCSEDMSISCIHLWADNRVSECQVGAPWSWRTSQLIFKKMNNIHKNKLCKMQWLDRQTINLRMKIDIFTQAFRMKTISEPLSTS